MKKKIIALAVAAAIAPAFAAAEGASVSGFADITYTNADDVSLFFASAETDVRNTAGNVTVGIDVDFELGLGNNTGSATLEQAFFAYKATDAVTVIGGVFNNPIGWEAEDAPDVDMINKSIAYWALDTSTSLYGNNIAGIAGAFNVGPATLIGAVLNDIGLKDSNGATSVDEHSVALVANFKAMEGLDIELGYVTQADDTGTVTVVGGNIVDLGLGNVFDANLTYKAGPATVKFDYVMPSEIVDSIIGLQAGFAINDATKVGARYEVMSFDAGGDDETAITINGAYKLADNLNVVAEWYSYDDGTDSDDSINLRFLAKF